MPGHLNYGKNIDGEWKENIPGAVPAPRVIGKVEKFFPKICLELLTKPVLEKMTKNWRIVVSGYVLDAVHED